jgi:endoglucanase Acf2
MKPLYRFGLALLVGYSCVGGASAQAVKVGAATYYLAPKSGDPAMPAAPLRTEAMLKRAAPTSQWYSKLIFDPKPEVIYAQPLTFKATPAGFEIAYPSKEVVPTVRRDVEIYYTPKAPIVVSPVAFEPGQAKLAGAGDWSVDVSMARGADDFRATFAHGSPFAYVQVSRGDLRLRLPAAGERFATDGDARMLALHVGARHYALFGPTGVRWEQVSPTEWLAHMPAGKGYLSVAALPDDKPATLALFTGHAWSFIEGTRVDWHYDPATSQVETTFTAATKGMEGPDNGPLLGLYPHQWFDNASVLGRLGPAYDTVRGQIKLLAASSFKTRYAYNGFVPYWPGITDAPRLDQLRDVMKSDTRNANRMMRQGGESGYWIGKGMQRVATMMDIADQQGDRATRDDLLKKLQDRMQDWFSGDSGRSYFAYDKSLGALSAYPSEFFSVEQINDHHFWYGYWIRTAAEIALRDPAWAAKDRWGGMVDLLVADIATPERGSAAFPFLRNFDPYEGHSWATGVGGVGEYGALGNNQESSSEAVNAWAALILWAEVKGDKALRDLGIYMYTTEMQGAQNYVFDIHHLVLAPEYKNIEVSQVFGGAYKHNTWWTDEPRQIKGINLLPITTASTYLGRDPSYVKRNMEALKVEMALYAKVGTKPSNPPPDDIWQDIFAEYTALADPAAGLAMWDRWGAVETGDSRTHTLHWLLSLERMGTPDFGVVADTSLYSVFRGAGGHKTYLAYNAGSAPIAVKFSDGKKLTVAARSLGRSD